MNDEAKNEKPIGALVREKFRTLDQAVVESLEHKLYGGGEIGPWDYDMHAWYGDDED